MHVNSAKDTVRKEETKEEEHDVERKESNENYNVESMSIASIKKIVKYYESIEDKGEEESEE